MPIGIDLTTTNAVYSSYGSILISDPTPKVHGAYASALIQNAVPQVYSAYASVLVPAYEAVAQQGRPRLNHRSFTMF